MRVASYSVVTFLCLVTSVKLTSGQTNPLLSSADPEVKLGDRLFFETRFAEYFFRRYAGNMNKPLLSGDPTVSDVADVPGEPAPGPFRGQSISCRHCHLGDDLIEKHRLEGRTYCDFSRRSAVPPRSDDRRTTIRNTPLMPDLGLPRDVPAFFHFDGEFSNPEDLIVGTLTGRNFGWLPGESRLAAAHIAKVIREDAGINARYEVDEHGNGIPYRVLLLGADANLPIGARIPAAFRIDVSRASDERILFAVAKLIHAYMDSLRFGTDHTFRSSISPYDRFLKKNGLPTEPELGESTKNYAIRLLRELDQKVALAWVNPKDDTFRLHDQKYQFGPLELAGLRVFFGQQTSRKAQTGNCVACHTPPQFTDFRFHNTGASQLEYDSIFGSGSFTRLPIPGFVERNSQPDTYLPATAVHPRARGRFRDVPSAGHPGNADLGLWNVIGNPDFPTPQEALKQLLCPQFGLSAERCTNKRLLPLTIGYFKTPSIRDLGQSYPYLHTGALSSIQQVPAHYAHVSKMARSGKLRNASPELKTIHIRKSDFNPLIAFLGSLNEDYH